MSRQPQEEGVFSRDLTNGGTVCLEKGLFTYFEELFTDEDECTGIKLYSDFYTRMSLVDTNVNISSFKRKKQMSQKVFETLYRQRTPLQKPKAFDFKSPSDLTRLARFLNIEIVVYYKINQEYEIWFSSVRVPLSEASEKTIVYFVTDHESTLNVIYDNDDIFLTVPFFSQSQVDVCDTFLSAFETLMQFPKSSCEQRTSEHFRANRELLTKEYKVNESIVVFVYSGNKVLNIAQRKLKQRTQPQKCNFVQTFLFLGKEPKTKEDISVLTPLILYGNMLCIPKPEFIERLRMQIGNSCQIVRDNVQLLPTQVGNIERLSKSKRQEAFEQCQEKRVIAKAKRKRKWTQKRKLEEKVVYKMLNITPEQSDNEEEEEPQPKKIEKICKCYICTKEADAYTENMSEEGQEQLCTIKHSCYELLCMLGINTQVNRDIINRLCEMSIASFDIEAMTLETMNQIPLNSFSKLKIGHSTIGGVPEHVIKLQKPIMIAHTDWLDELKVYTLSDYIGEEESIYEMVEHFWDDVVKKHAQIKECKTQVAEPLLTYLKEYRNVHMDIIANSDFAKDTDNQANMGKNYYNTLPGLLEQRITRLIQEYVIFSFYGSGYDMVLLESYLLPYLYETKARPKIDKKGDKVTLIRTSMGITFRDVTKLLAPSTNLRSFGKLFNLPVEKGHFPFKILKNVESLLLPELPTTLYMWQSELTGSAKITEKEMKEALDFYKKSGFKNVGEYLRHYLILDVKILQQATNMWRKRLFEIIGLDFIDIQKYTISSLSYYANAQVSASLCRPGWFFPNNSQHYALLKRGMRG